MKQPILSLSLAALLGVCIAWGGETIKEAKAQFIQPKLIAPVVYQRLPSFPLENNYINQESGEVDEDHTLASRFIRYHLYIKGRSPNYRLDWKLTLADYLGANERLEKARYPGATSLRENPFERDRTTIRNLNRQQREELVAVLVGIFNPSAAENNTPAPEKQPDPETEVTPNNRLSLPQPGDAQLLLP